MAKSGLSRGSSTMPRAKAVKEGVRGCTAGRLGLMTGTCHYELNGICSRQRYTSQMASSTGHADWEYHPSSLQQT